MKKITTIIFLVFSTSVFAAPPILVDQQTGKHLGTLSENPCVGGSIPLLATKQIKGLSGFFIQSLFSFP